MHFFGNTFVFEKYFFWKFFSKIVFWKYFSKIIFSKNIFFQNFSLELFFWIQNFFLPTLVEVSSSGLKLKENKIFLQQWVEISWNGFKWGRSGKCPYITPSYFNSLQSTIIRKFHSLSNSTHSNLLQPMLVKKNFNKIFSGKLFLEIFFFGNLF